MDKRVAEALVAAGEEIGTEIRIYEDYSGRGMYGDKTTGVVVDDISDLVAVAFVAGRMDAEEAASDEDYEELDLSFRLRSDSLGRSVIVY